jgi:hypothetical protein
MKIIIKMESGTMGNMITDGVMAVIIIKTKNRKFGSDRKTNGSQKMSRSAFIVRSVKRTTEALRLSSSLSEEQLMRGCEMGDLGRRTVTSPYTYVLQTFSRQHGCHLEY